MFLRLPAACRLLLLLQQLNFFACADLWLLLRC